MAELTKMVTNIAVEMSGDTRKYMVSAKQGDKATRYIAAKLLNNGVLYTIPEQAAAVINMKKPDGKHVYNSCTHDGEEIIIELTNQMLSAAGTAYCDIEIRTPDFMQIITSASFTIEIEESIRNDSAILSSNEFTELEAKMTDVKSSIEKSKQMEEEESKRVEAEKIREKNEEERKRSIAKSVEDTLKAAETAGTAAESADAAATTAGDAANDATDSAARAESYAHGGTGIREGEEEDNALFYKNQAQEEAERAQKEAERAQAIVNIGNAQQGIPGIVKPDGETTSVDEDGTIHALVGSLKIYTDVSEIGLDAYESNSIVAVFECMPECAMAVLNCHGTFGEPITPEDLPPDAQNGILTIYKMPNYNYIQMVDWYGGRDPAKKVYYNAVLDGWDEANEADILLLGEWYAVNGLGILRGDYDIAIGNGAGKQLDDYANMQNVAVGGNALSQNTATRNVAIGGAAMLDNVSGNYNTAVGDCAGMHLVGNQNVAIGRSALIGQAEDIPNEGSNNVAVGNGAMYQNATGGENVAIGSWALYKNTTGSYNTAVGRSALYENTAGNKNTAVGISALHDNIEGIENVAIGVDSLRYNTGNRNTAVGKCALHKNTTGEKNVAIGKDALFYNDAGNYNVAVGVQTLQENISGSYNMALGYQALYSNDIGETNVAIGERAMYKNKSGKKNIAIGSWALSSVVETNSCVAVGKNALKNHVDGPNCVAIGDAAMELNDSHGWCVGVGALKNGGTYSVALGHDAMYDAGTNWNNTAIGAGALGKVQGGSNTAVGRDAMSGDLTCENSSALGHQATVTGSNQVQLGNESTTTYTYGAVQNRSDERDKTDIHDTDLGLDFINRLRPVKFRWDYRESYTESVDQINEAGEPETVKIKHKKDGSRAGKRYHEGLIAQEVKKVMEEMGVEFAGYQDHAINGGQDVLSIGYTELITPLIKAVQELSLKVDELKIEAGLR